MQFLNKTGYVRLCNIEARSCNHRCCVKAMSITQHECVFCVCACSFWYPACNAHAPYSSVACTALQYFSTLSHKWKDFRKQFRNTKCVFLFSPQFLSETFLILRGNKRYIIKVYIGLHVKYPLFLSDFNETSIFSADFRKTFKYQTL
jgi:hypothetical protein